MFALSNSHPEYFFFWHPLNLRTVYCLRLFLKEETVVTQLLLQFSMTTSTCVFHGIIIFKNVRLIIPFPCSVRNLELNDLIDLMGLWRQIVYTFCHILRTITISTSLFLAVTPIGTTSRLRAAWRSSQVLLYTILRVFSNASHESRT